MAVASVFAITCSRPCAVIYAQQPGVKLYNVADGLPVPSVHAMYQDKYGYLWIGTPSGLSQFDGRQFVNFSIADGLQSTVVSLAFQDSGQRLWLATKAGMAQFKSNRFITYPTSDKMANPYVFDFFETREKKIWALTASGVYAFTGSAWKKITLCPGYENTPCRGIIEINGELFINYTSVIVCRNKQGRWLTISPRSFYNVMSVQDGKLWVSTGSNIYQISNHQLLPLYKTGIGHKGFFHYLIDSKKRMWIARGNVVKKSAPGDWQHFTDSLKQAGDCSFVKEDAGHNIWIGTNNGLLKLNDIAFDVIDKYNGVPLTGISNIIPLPDNKLLLSSGTKTGLLQYIDTKGQRISTPALSIDGRFDRDIVDAYAFDQQHSLWMATRFRKLLHFDGKKIKDFSPLLQLKTTENIYDMIYAKQRKQLFICADSTLLYGTSSMLQPFVPANTKVPIIKPTRVREIKNGLLLLYVDGQGVYAIDKANNLFSLIKETGIDGRNKGIELGICFYESSDGNFWIAVPGRGLYEYGFSENKRPFLINHITTDNGLQSNNAFAMVNDLKNRLWVATTTGIDILQKGKAGNWEVFNYAKSDDLPVTIIDFLDHLITDKQGNIWLSAPNKVIKFNVDEIRLHKEPPRIIIEKITLDFKETDWSKLTDSLRGYYQLPNSPVLNYSQNSLGIFFNAVDLSASYSNPEYSYKLWPIETSWSIPSKIKSVSFAQLPAGTYKFIVRAKDHASGWSARAVFQFTITPPFWARWWFRTVVILLASFIVVSVFRGRIKKVRADAQIQNQLKELEMKALKAQMNPHFIYNALNSIQALVANDKKTEGVYYIGSFSRLLRQVLDNSENNVISLDKELETVDLYIQLESLRLDMQLQYQKIIPEIIVTEFEKIPPLILQPFVENSLWHGLSRKEGEKKISISVSQDNDWLIFEITDNGIGRAQAGEWKSRSAIVNQSKGIDITYKRLIDFNDDNRYPPIAFVDLYDEQGKAAGTQAIVYIKRKSGSPFN